MMADQEDEELKMALRLSMQHDPPEPKRSKPGEDSGGGGGDEAAEELRIRRKQRELMAAAAEKRMNFVKKGEKDVNLGSIGGKNVNLVKGEGQNVNLGMELSEKEAHQLFSMIFGDGVTMDILAQWSNQGIRFSPDPDTSMGLVQHEGGPCGVLAAIQAFVLKYLLFPTEEIGSVSSLGSKKLSRSLSVTTDIFSSLTEDKRSRWFSLYAFLIKL
ncbi:hypothetical protein Leryth_012381 [Lithospermum erythrorhizon]|nr:hypothetical protein Leryth_012381 [Lithospermum erythrorhizon]